MDSARRLSTLPPPPSPVSRRISSSTLTALAQDCADARMAHELSELERARLATTAAVLAGRSRSTLPARPRGKR